MCDHFSGWLLRDETKWSPRSNSHTGLVEIHQLHIDGARGPNGVKFQILPPKNWETWEDLATWRVQFDQDQFPEWFDRAECEARARAVAATARSIDPVWWRVMTAASRNVDWTGEHRTKVLGDARVVMPGANLGGANLGGANLCRANLGGADLYGANLGGANRLATDPPIPGWRRTEGGILVPTEGGADG